MAMNTCEKKHQLTQDEIRAYFVRDTREVNQRKSKLDALNARLDQLAIQEKSFQRAKVSGVVITALDIIRLLLLGLQVTNSLLSADSSYTRSDANISYIVLCTVLLLAEMYLISRNNRYFRVNIHSRYFKIYASSGLLLLLFYIAALSTLTSDTAVASAGIIFTLFHLYPLIVGISRISDAYRRKQTNQEEIQEILNRQVNLLDRPIQQVNPPTDQEFDAWLEDKVEQDLTRTIKKMGLQDEIINYRKLLRVRGYVLPGMKDAKHYRHGDLRYKIGLDGGKMRYSVNLYTYFYLGDYRIVVFTYAINAINWNDYRETTREYFYQDIIGIYTEYDSDNVNINGNLYPYRTQRFCLSLRDGQMIKATVHAQPLDDTTNLPAFEVPMSDLEENVAWLRKSLQSKKA